MAPEPVLYYAPGAGLGHLVRALAICEMLGDRGIRARIVTNSPFAKGLARIAGVPVQRVADKKWREGSRAYAEQRRPKLIVLDSFPLGLRGEWAPDPPRGARYLYLARRLKLDAYREAMGADWERLGPHIERVIVAEPLSEEHESLLNEHDAETAILPGRVRLSSFRDPPPPPSELEELLNTGRPWLVVHSGPPEETGGLIEMARSEMEAQGRRDPLAAVTPRPPKDAGCPCFEYFPASALYDRAAKVVTGAGYNAVAEMSRWPDKHFAHPFDRRYDDQADRLDSGFSSEVNGGPAAADFIANAL